MSNVECCECGREIPDDIDKDMNAQRCTRCENGDALMTFELELYATDEDLTDDVADVDEADQETPQQRIARILRYQADRIEAGEECGRILLNGGHVGDWQFQKEADA